MKFQLRLKTRIATAVLCTVLMSSIATHGQVSTRLNDAMLDGTTEFYTVRIEFTENVDCYALNHAFKQAELSVTERPKEVISRLQEQARISQSEVLGLIETELSNETKNVHSFWIVNAIVLDATSSAIEQLAEMSTVLLVDLEDSDIIAHDPIIREEDSSPERSPNGIEPGLEAINAPAMWALGYTGRGRLGYVYDTGVWPTHPAFSYRFIGNRFPIEQAWTGFFSNEPNGNVSDHGTHVLGTMAGLVESTNDTIGVAFDSYWIANDLVTSTVEELPPIAAMISAFEWALNPDGNINTTDDIPDVINNSWRWRDDPDTVQCAGLVVNLMNAIEAAGIANIFSGGNSGPTNSTVNAPQRINTSEVNTFSVGSVNGNVAFPYPISNFSTRGPKQCPHDGNISLEIHPEVVAPGQNVRSAWGKNEFNTISGTSMASPHVSGSILLLKEAFPYLTGEELMWALYQTAVDLGDIGEDNVFGMGMIDVYAAFQQLSQDHTPADPNDTPWDLEIADATVPVSGGYTCENAFSINVSFKNRGTDPITEVQFSYSVNGGSSNSATWTGTLQSGETTNFQLPQLTVNATGDMEVAITGTIAGSPTEYDLYNNHWRTRFNIRGTKQLPFVDGFEAGFDEEDWYLDNGDDAVSWDTTSTGGLNWSNYSASVELYNYSPRANQRDGLISSLLEIPNTNEPVWLVFDRAYQSRSSSNAVRDTLQVLVSVDCGATFDEIVFDKSGEDLSTNDTTQLNFVPEFEWDWTRDTVNLSQFSGQDILLQFRTINRRGNNVFIDNVKVFVGNAEPAGIDEVTQSLRIYPNPSSKLVNIQTEYPLSGKTEISVANTIGSIIPVPWSYGSNSFQIDVSELSSGLYTVLVTDGNLQWNARFVKTE